ncbi:MAG: DegT/DnrJ/EryC1/StrS family aminotransferase [Candidatus Omnitrophica bacterium]|nr:DegT/DnrJ/EryC1/StrS family aminotransferase [Candidatus Omnitrophota bacterium]
MENTDDCRLINASPFAKAYSFGDSSLDIYRGKFPKSIVTDRKRFGITRDELYEALKAENIQTKEYFYPAVHMQKAYFSLGVKYKGKLPVTEKAADR